MLAKAPHCKGHQTVRMYRGRDILRTLQSHEVCFVLGIGTQTGLSIVRSLGRKGIRVVGVDNAEFPMGRMSRYCHAFIRYADYSRLRETLIHIGRQCDRKFPIIVSSDALALFMDEQRIDLSPYYLFNWQPTRRIDDMINKQVMLRLAGEIGLETPRTWQSDECSLDRIQAEISFPALIKPSYTAGTKKGVIVTSLQELQAATRQDLFRAGFIVQEFISGPETNIVVVETYSNRQGDVVALSCGRKVRQLPRDVGIATYIEPCHEGESIAQAIRFVKYLGYFGIADIEFKKSLSDGRYKFIEINPRASGFNEFAIAQGVDLPYLCYCDLLGRLGAQGMSTADRRDAVWISFLDDMHTFFRFYFTGNPRAVFNWMREIRHATTDAIFSFQDIVPFLMALRDNAFKPIRRITQKAPV